TELPQVEILYRLHYATDGVVGNVMNLLRFAMLMAQAQGAEALTLALLSQTFDKRLRKHMTGKVNPFGADISQPFTGSPAFPSTPPPTSTRKQKRQR
ncbi:MAG: hypothetical protein WBO46_02760, partial [Caldilineaceae bacterium]